MQNYEKLRKTTHFHIGTCLRIKSSKAKLCEITSNYAKLCKTTQNYAQWILETLNFLISSTIQDLFMDTRRSRGPVVYLFISLCLRSKSSSSNNNTKLGSAISVKGKNFKFSGHFNSWDTDTSPKVKWSSFNMFMHKFSKRNFQIFQIMVKKFEFT